MVKKKNQSTSAFQHDLYFSLHPILPVLIQSANFLKTHFATNETTVLKSFSYSPAVLMKWLVSALSIPSAAAVFWTGEAILSNSAASALRLTETTSFG